MSALKLVINRQSRSLVNYGGGILSVPPLFQSNKQDLIVQVVDPTGSFGSPFSIVNLNGLGLRVAVGQTPTGTSGGPTPLALQTTWTWNATNSWFTGTLELNTAAVDSYISSAAARDAYFEVNIVDGSDRKTILQEVFSLKAVVDEATSTAPTPTDSYLTTAESLATFVKKTGGNGEVIILKSPGGIYAREIGIADDGSLIDNIITL